MLSEITFLQWEERLETLKKRCQTYNIKTNTGYLDSDRIMLLSKDESSANRALTQNNEIHAASIDKNRTTLYKIIKRTVNPSGYILADRNGNRKPVTNIEALKLTIKGKIVNATMVTNGKSRFLRGKKCSLKDLPTEDLSKRRI